MAEILRGRRKGEIVTPVDCKNNYVQFDDGTFKNIGSVLFTGDEVRMIKQSGSTGTLLIDYEDRYDPVLNGHLFKKKKRHYAYN